MAYFPTELPGGDLTAWVMDELRAIARELNGGMVELDQLHAVPEKPRDGLVVYADGTNWNPDATNGEGVYVYYASAWHFLG